MLDGNGGGLLNHYLLMLIAISHEIDASRKAGAEGTATSTEVKDLMILQA